jgi:hypothetical protein
MTGHEGAFTPIDLLQEHNVRDIKVRSVALPNLRLDGFPLRLRSLPLVPM